MDERVCSRCHVSKPLSEYYKATPTRYRSDCKDCHKEVMKPRSRAHYTENKPYYLKRNTARSQAIVAFIREYKTGKTCADCKLPHPFWRLDFDHIGIKDENLSAVRRRKWSIKRIMQEIAKCELVCANCHRDRTYRRAHGCSEGERVGWPIQWPISQMTLATSDRPACPSVAARRASRDDRWAR